MIILHQSFSLAVTLLHIFNPGPSWDSRSYTLWSMKLLWQRKTEMRKGRTSGRLLICCSEMPCVHFTSSGQNKSHGLMWGEENFDISGVEKYIPGKKLQSPTCPHTSTYASEDRIVQYKLKLLFKMSFKLLT